MEVAWSFTLLILGILLLLNLHTEYRLKELLMALADDLRNIEEQLNKANTEITGKIDALEGALANSGEQTQEVTDAVAALKAVSQSLDDVVADAAAPVEEAVEAVEAEVVEAEAETVEAEAVETAEAVEAVEAVETEAVEAVEGEAPSA
jgi:uncharacterized membrane protein YccC